MKPRIRSFWAFGCQIHAVLASYRQIMIDPDLMVLVYGRCGFLAVWESCNRHGFVE